MTTNERLDALKFCVRGSESSDHSATAHDLGAHLGAAVSFATTEHFNLQTARAQTVSEANGRANIYLAAVSSSLVALAFVGQTSRLGTAFYAFALILLPVLAFVGVVTFLRLVQTSLEDIAYAQRIGRLRGFYLRVAPELEAYVVVSRELLPSAQADGRSSVPSAWQLPLTVAGMVAVVNCVVLAACAGLAFEAAGVDAIVVPLAGGAFVGLCAFWLHERHHQGAFAAHRTDTVDHAAIYIPPPADAL